MFALSLLVLSLLVAAVAGEYVGLWSISRPALNWAVRQPALAPHVAMYRVGRGDWEEWEERQEAQRQWEEDLRREARRLADEWVRLETERRALERQMEALKQEEARIERRLAALEEAERRAEGLERLRELYAAMRPEEAAVAAAELDDGLLVELLQGMDAARAARLLGQMDPERVARITRLMRQGG